MLAGLLTACSADAIPHTSVDPIIRDSAGIALVFHSPAGRTTLPKWDVESAPLLKIGVADGEAVYQFDRIRGVSRLTDGTITVLDGGSHQLRYYSGTGRHLLSIGRKGRGPGETQNPMFLERLPGDVLQIQDNMSRLRYSSAGDLLSHERLPIERLHSAGAGFIVDCPVPGFVGQHVLSCRGNNDVRDMPREPGPWRIESLLLLSPWTLERTDTLGIFLIEDAWVVRYEDAGMLGYASPPLSRRGLFAIGGWPRRLVHALTDVYAFRVIDLESGTLRTIVEAPVARRRPTAEEVQRAWLESARSNPRRVGSLQRHLAAPDSAPPVLDMRVDDDGMIWVRLRTDGREDGMGRWEVFSSDGMLVAYADVPAAIRIHEIGNDYLLGTTRDDMHVEYVVMHRLTRSSSASANGVAPMRTGMSTTHWHGRSGRCGG